MANLALSLPLALLGAVACMSAAAPPQPAARAAACGEQSASTSIKVVPVAPQAVAGRLEWSETRTPGFIKVDNAFQTTGRCTADVHGFVLSQVSLSSGMVFEQVTENGPFLPREGGVANSVLSDLLVRNTPHPTLPAKEFLMAEKVSVARRGESLATNYVGLWRGKGEWSVLAYTQEPDGRFSAPQVVLSSRQPLRSMSYFPHPDSPAGRLGLVQEDGASTVLLINMHWSHPAAFR